MDALLSQLAQTAAKERALLEECGDLLSVAATLEVKNHAPNIQSPLTGEIQDWYKVNLSSDCFFLGFFRNALKQSEVKFTK
jgi:hypothetical protein